MKDYIKEIMESNDIKLDEKFNISGSQFNLSNPFYITKKRQSILHV